MATDGMSAAHSLSRWGFNSLYNVNSYILGTYICLYATTPIYGRQQAAEPRLRVPFAVGLIREPLLRLAVSGAAIELCRIGLESTYDN
jgi:hypothetical protein